MILFELFPNDCNLQSNLTYATTQNFLSLTKGDRLGESPASVMVLWVETLWHFWWVVDYKIQYSYQLKLSQKSTVNPIFISPGTYLFQGRLRGVGGGGVAYLINRIS